MTTVYFVCFIVLFTCFWSQFYTVIKVTFTFSISLSALDKLFLVVYLVTTLNVRGIQNSKNKN